MIVLLVVLLVGMLLERLDILSRHAVASEHTSILHWVLCMAK